MALDGSVHGGVTAVRAALERYGPAPGGKKMLQWELEVRQQWGGVVCVIFLVGWRKGGGGHEWSHREASPAPLNNSLVETTQSPRVHT